ncbi:MAG TPA: ABC transporter ATP-binding protein [Actinopolymorphaceae bacterium]|jgi:ABC-2 type transport system ATP-binding protein|nr:ABC transporter ATP-binding protein [Actinopolymorphaceae bacterium]
MTALVIEHLTKRYGDLAALDAVSFEVPEGQLVAILGPNGAGKTTLVEALEGFVEPTSGLVRVLGTDPRRGGRAWRARVGLVLQSTSLDPEPTVREMFTLFAGLYPEPRSVAEVLELVDLTAEAGARVGTLSGGQQRRVDLGLAVIGRPELVFLDEPTTGLDPEARQRTWTTIEGLTDAGTTVVLTTHYMDEADRLADRVLVLVGGRIVADMTPSQLRAGSGPATVRLPLPYGVQTTDLPPSLAAYVLPAERVLLARSSDVTGVLRDLVSWADRRGVDLTGLEVGPPSLEDAYLTLAGGTLTQEAETHV